ncbi:MAG: MFS transporter [Deltaproteobacteria bacterium]
MSINQNLIKLTFADFLVRSAYQMGKSPVLPLMAASLGADALFLGMIVSVSTMTGLGMKPLFGLLSDRWGRRFWIIGGTLIFTGMPFLYGSIENPTELMLLRLAHGLATAIYGPVTLAWVLDQGRKGCAERVGWFGIAKNGGYIVGPLAGASLLSVMEPVEVFTVIGLISILALIPVLMLPTEHKNAASGISWKKQISGSFKAGLGLPELWIAGGLECFLYIGLYAVKAFLPLMALSEGIPIIWIGVFFSVQELSHLLLRPLGGRIGDRNGYLLTAASGLVLASGALWALPVILDVSALISVSIVFGMAQALILPSCVALFANQIDYRHTGSGTGFFGSMKNLGKICGPILGGWLVHHHQISWMLWSLSGLLTLFSLIMFCSLMGRKGTLQTTG